MKTPEEIARGICLELVQCAETADAQRIIAEAVRAALAEKSCARNQGSTQFCAEAARLAEERDSAIRHRDRLTTKLSRLRDRIAKVAALEADNARLRAELQELNDKLFRITEAHAL